MTSVDNLAGAAGTDTLTATLNNGLTVRPTLSGIENLNLTAVTANSAIDLAAATGVTSVTALSSSSNLTVSRISDAATSLKALGNSGQVSFGFSDAALAAAGQTIALTVDGQTGQVTITDEGGANKAETVAINAQNTASSFALVTTNVGTTAVTVSGDADLTLGTLSSAVVNLNASSATGDVSAALSATAAVTLTGGTGDDTLSSLGAYADSLNGGAGDDTLSLDADELTSTDTVAGGEGDDTLALVADADADSVVDADFTNVSSVETFQGQTDTDALTIVLGTKAAAAGITTINADSTGNDSVTAGATFTNNATVALSTGNDTVDFSATSVALNVTAAAASITASDNIYGGSGTNDKLTLTADSDATGAVLDASFTGLESIVIAKSGVKTAKVTIADDQGLALKTFTIDASALTGGVASVTVNASAEATATATISVVGSAGADTITMGAGLSVVNGGEGNDSIRFAASGNLTSSDSINGGAGNDTLGLMDPDDDTTGESFTLVDVDLTNVTSVENIAAVDYDSTDLVALTATLGSIAQAAGVVSVTGGDGAESITLSATYTAGLTYTAGAGADTFDASLTSTGQTVVFAAGELTDADTITGSTGSDTVKVTNSGAADFSVTLDGDFTAVETIQVLDKNGYDYSITTNDANVASTKTLTVDGSALLNNSGATDGQSTLTVDASAETNGKVSLIGGAGNDSLTGGAGSDTIDGGAGNDQITGYTGYDSLSGGAGNDNFVMATEAQFTGTSAGVVSSDTVVGGEGTDTITFSATATLTAAKLANVSGVEVIALTGSDNTATLTNAVYTANGSSSLTIDAAATTGTGAVISASGLTGGNAVTIKGTTTADVNESYTGGAGNDTFRFVDTTDVLEAVDTIAGGAGTDVIEIDFDGENAGDIELDRISGIESVVVRAAAWTADATSDTLTIAIANAAYDQATLTIDASAIGAASDGSASNTDEISLSITSDSDEAFNVIGSAGADTISAGSGADTVSGGAGADSITGGAGLDNLSGGAGNDEFVVATAAHFSNLSAAETVNGGDGTDTLTISAASATISAADLGAISSIEKVTISGATSSVTLADSVYTANGKGVTIVEGADIALTVQGGGVGSANSVSVIFDATTADSLIGGAGNDVFEQVDEAANTGVGATQTITGGAGTDTLKLHVEGAATTSHDLTLVSGIETLAIYAGAATDGDASTDIISVTTADATVALGATLTADFSTFSYGADYTSTTFAGKVVFDGSAESSSSETLGKFVVTAGSGTSSITGGASTDSLTGGAGADTLIGGAGADSLNGAAGTDSITGGAGADVIYGGTGSDTFVLTAVSESSGSNVDNIADWNSTDDTLKVTLSYSTLTTDQTVNAVRATAVAGLTNAQNALTGERGQYIYDTDNSMLYINVNNDNLITALDYKIQLLAGTTASSTVATTDINFTITTGSGADTITTDGGADTIDGGAGADTIVGGAGADSITGSAGADSIDGGSGSDAIVLTDSEAVADTVVFSQTSGLDTVTGFTTTEDLLKVTIGGANGGEIATGAGATASVTSDRTYVQTSATSSTWKTGGSETVADMTDLSDVAAYIAERYTATAAGDTALFILNDGTSTYAYYFVESASSGASTISSTELTLIGTFTSAVLVAADVTQA